MIEKCIIYLCFAMKNFSIERKLLLQFILLIHYYHAYQEKFREMRFSPDSNLVIEDTITTLLTPAKLKKGEQGKKIMQRMVGSTYSSLLQRFNRKLRAFTEKGYLSLDENVNKKEDKIIEAIHFISTDNLDFTTLTNIAGILNIVYDRWLLPLYYHSLEKAARLAPLPKKEESTWQYFSYSPDSSSSSEINDASVAISSSPSLAQNHPQGWDFTVYTTGINSSATSSQGEKSYEPGRNWIFSLYMPASTSAKEKNSLPIASNSLHWDQEDSASTNGSMPIVSKLPPSGEEENTSIKKTSLAFILS